MAHVLPGLYLEMVCGVAVCVFGDVQEDEEILSDVVSHGGQPGKTVLREAEFHDLSGWGS